jgi:hypothetical protein
MLPTPHFGKLARQARGNVARFRARANSVCFVATSIETRIQIAHITTGLLNTWTEFCRAYYLSCLLRPKRTKGGAVSVTFSSNKFEDAIAAVMKRFRPHIFKGGSWSRRDEPPWHDVATLVFACSDLGCSNLPQIQAAVSVPTRVFSDLPVFRNFFSHRNRSTMQSCANVALTYGIVASHPCDSDRPLERRSDRQGEGPDRERDSRACARDACLLLT